MTVSPRFVTFEGIEGSGKSLQLSLLQAEMARRRTPCLFSREPGGTRFGERVRDILLSHDGVGREPLAELLLYLADRHQHLKEVVEPALARGFHVVSDRYHDATMAYQGHARGIGFDKIDRLAEILELRRPDLTLVLDVEVRVGLERARARNLQENSQRLGRFESEETAFHERVREGYRLLAERDPERVVHIDGSGAPEEVFRRVLPVLEAGGVFDLESSAPGRERP